MDSSYETATIKLSSKLKKRAPPILATFSCGQLKENSKIEFECFKSIKDENLENKKTDRILKAQTQYLTYEGSSTDNSVKFPSQYFIGVRNKSGKIKLYGTSFFHLKPIINKASKAIENSTESEPSTSYWEGRNKLTAAFGGKTSKRILGAHLKFAVDADSVEPSKLEALPTPETTPSLENEQSQSYLPSVNRKTESLEEVYNMNEIISPEDDVALDEHAEYFYEILKTDPESAKVNLCKFVQNLIEKPVDPQNLKYLLYYNYMVKLQNLNYSDIRKKDPTSLIPEPFKQSLIEKFTTMSKYESGRSVRVFPPQQRDKLVAHIFVLALHISNYSVNINCIIEDLKRVTPKQLSLIAQTLGCHVTSAKLDDNPIKVAELKLPLFNLTPKFKKMQF